MYQYVSRNDDRNSLSKSNLKQFLEDVSRIFKISPLSASKMPQLEARSRQRRSCDTGTASF